jgi:hypothetical protein
MQLKAPLLLLTAADQKVARFSLSWVAVETYAPEWRPQLTDAGRQGMVALLDQLDGWQASGGRDVELAEGGAGSSDRPPRLVVPAGSFNLLALAVRSFVRAVGPIPNEFRIITGLPTADAEALLVRLEPVGSGTAEATNEVSSTLSEGQGPDATSE